jgi:hypothetical protein
MAIVFNCPYCHEEYNLKDEFAGRTATCRNPDCRQKIVIPKPTVSDDTPPPADVEAAALAAWSDEPAKAEQPAERVIDVECLHCGHKWTEPQARAGKNTLCPECRERVRIPELKEDELPGDWRQKRTKLPSLAKGQHEQPEDVQDAGKAVMVQGESLKKAGAIDEDIEPRPRWQKVMFVVAPVVALAGIGFGIWSLMKSRTADKEHTLMKEAQEEFAQTIATLPPSDVSPEVPLCTAILHVAAGEYALRQNQPEKLKEAMDQFAKAREALREASRKPHGPAWNAACGELAVAQLGLGGTDEQVRDQTRIRWVPDANQRVRPNERVFTVLEELRQTLQLIQGTEFEFRNHLARRLARELARRGQAAFAVDQLPLALFPQEPDEAKAIAALEVFRADRNSDVARRAAAELKDRAPELLKGNPRPASAMTLFLVLAVDKPPPVVGTPAGNSPSDGSRFAYAGHLLLEGKSGEALELARRPGAADQQLRALVLCADWSADPGPALDAAQAVVAGKKKDGPALSPFAILRLSQVASAAGRHDQANRFADALADEGLRVWAKGDAVRLRAAASPAERADEAWAEVPKDLKSLRAGHGWGRLWVARQNARLSGDRAAEVKAVGPWPTGISPFGKAGVALGLQDRDQ